jgi:hypothetical protein
MDSIRMSALLLGMSLCSSNPQFLFLLFRVTSVLTEVFNVFHQPFQWNDSVLVYRPLSCSFPCSYITILPFEIVSESVVS